MAEEKKPKIDLKSRLKKTEVGTAVPAPANGPGSVPPPVIPAPIPVPSAGIPAPLGGIPAPIGGGIPAPPFAQPSAQQAPARPPQPVADPTDPLASVAVAPVSRREPEIKIDMTEAAQEAAKGMRKFIVIAGVAGAVIGLGLGSVIGGGNERANREASAIAGASLLLKDVEDTNKKLEEFKTKLDEGMKALSEKKFPETLSADLGKLAIDFDGNKLYGKGLGSYDGATQKVLFQYTSDVQALDNKRESLMKLFASRKKAIEEFLKASEKPAVNFGLIIIKDPKGPIGKFAPVSAPFEIGGDWPKDINVLNFANQQVMATPRYVEGDPLKDPNKPFVVPIDPKTVAAAFPNDAISTLRSELQKAKALVDGEANSTDDDAKTGLIKLGGQAAEQLKKIVAKGKG
ncbi:MAG: hypothetical protein U0165_05745 [Polyangiaceae bacterium]